MASMLSRSSSLGDSKYNLAPPYSGLYVILDTCPGGV